ncbi:DNA-3-methyladenine glycosylase [Phycicoccus sp. MAQZ13P-2]|uniref:DNA-3-methyladenine glycosylase n=1 Tax=Phycicoccus mangrovi TaxID=2840470 RepID=UPI001C0009BF|nr:DNA-3-methyladenine glycosylase [Phycicoccus mangrovi]MBT9257587.1 DNA-3-methyladenine glycosylase [Phycicoccus mangrovi]MBT9275744.1 DNA-3-methyladenine glycosylase [Phycicoccus mangrovi]
MPSVAEVLRGDVLGVAPRLLGAHLTHAGVTLRLTEVEAYAGSADPGSHAFRGRTPRTEVMFGRAGLLYVYFTYGMHFCANVVTGTEGSASAVLLRAGEVVDGHATAAERRPGVRQRDLARGPARLARTLALGREQNGLDLLDPTSDGELVLADPVDPAVVATGPRVGVSGAGGDGAVFPWRFWLVGEPTVSPYRAAVTRRRPASGRG